MKIQTYLLLAAALSGVLFVSGIGAFVFFDTLEFAASAISSAEIPARSFSQIQKAAIEIGIVFTSLLTFTAFASAIWQLLIERRRKLEAAEQTKQHEQFRAAILDTIPAEIAGIADVLSGARKDFQMEYPCQLTDESGCFLIQAVAAPPSIGGAIIAHIDISAGRIAEQALRANEELLRTMIAAIPDTVQVKDAHGRWLLANDAALQHFKVGTLAWHGKTDAEIQALTPTAAMRGCIECRDIERQAWQQARPIRTLKEVTEPGAPPRHFDVIKSPLLDGAHRPKLLVVVGRDITQQKQAEEALRELSDELEARVTERTAKLEHAMAELQTEIAGRLRLEQEILKISEREQMRIGQDLHDDLGQQLVGMAILTDLLAKELRDEAHPRAASAAKLSHFLNHSIETTRDLARAFYPVELERGGLRLAFQDLSNRSQQLANIACTIQMDGAFQIPKSFEIHLYRIVQESITNAIKHGHASAVEISCHVTDAAQVVTITSNGSSFSPPGAGTQTGMGLHLFQCRASLIGAKITVVPGRRNGCVVTCTLEKPHAAHASPVIS